MGDIYTDPPESRNEALVKAIIDGTEYTDPPQSRNEAILKSIIDGTEYTDPPQSRMEDLLIQLKEGGGGGSGTINLIETVPTYTGTMTYNGTEQTATFNNYDSEKMTVSGNTATNAGTYTATFKPKKGYYWDNGDSTATNEPKTVTWSIEKATASITLSESAVTLNAETLYTDVNITATVGTGALSVASSDTTVATVGDIENDTFRITANNDENSGNATVTVSMAESDNYTSASATVAVDVSFIVPTIYGVQWNGSTSPVLTRTDGAANFANPNPYYAGMSGTPSSPFDNCMPWRGMEIVEDANAGTLVKIPKFWYKWTISGSSLKLQIANYEADGFSVSPAHMDRGDGQGERDFVYVGRYKSGSDYKSKTGETANTAVLSTFRTNIRNLGSGIHVSDFAMLWTIRMLYLVEFANWDAQSCIGYGCGEDYDRSVGYTDSMPYHTGTMQTSRATYGKGTQYRHIEGLWNYSKELIDGIYGDTTAGNNMYGFINPNDYHKTSGGTVLFQVLSQGTNGVIKKFAQINASGFEWGLYPSESGGTDYTQYTCSKLEINRASYNQTVMETWNQPKSRGAGMFSTYFCGNTSDSVRVQKLPNNA